MRKYWFQLLNADNYETYDCFIPDGNNKKTAERFAKRWMKENKINEATLEVSSIATSNILDMIHIEL